MKTGVKLSSNYSSTAETTESLPKSSVLVYTDKHATAETTSSDDVIRPHIKTIDNASASKESDWIESDENKLHIRINEDRSATKQSEAESDNIPKLRTHADRFATKQSTDEHDLNVPRLRHDPEHCSSKESEGTEWKIKKASVHGHASEQSTAEFKIPHLKPRPKEQLEVSDIDFKDFRIKPRIKINKDMYASKESEVTEPKSWSGIRCGKVSANMESEFVDNEAILRDRFKVRNVYGHASDSTVEKLLYGRNRLEESIHGIFMLLFRFSFS